MTKFFNAFHKLNLFPIILILLAGLATTSIWPAWAYRNQGQSLLANNRTSGFQVVDMQVRGNQLQLSLRNNYSKNITAYTISVGNVRAEEDFIYSNRVIAPGEVYTVNTPISSSDPSTSILAVVFEDGTSDGEASVAAAIRDRRQGEKAQLTRILPLIENALRLSDSELPRALSELPSRISSLPAIASAGRSREFRSGLRNGSEDALRTIQRISQATDYLNLREELIRIQAHYSRAISKL